MHLPYSRNFPVVCPSCRRGVPPSGQSADPDPGPIVRRQAYFRQDDRRWIQRYYCKRCELGFSDATQDPEYRQRTRSRNLGFLSIYSSTGSLNRLSIILRLNRKTVVRKVLFMAQQTQRKRLDLIEDLKRSGPW